MVCAGNPFKRLVFFLASICAGLLLTLAACQVEGPGVQITGELPAEATPGGSHSLVVSPTGKGVKCLADNPCSLTTANGAAEAGDTVILKAGEYTAPIKPARDGMAEKPITYQAEGEVVFSSQNNCAVLDQRKGIILHGLRFSDCLSSWITATNAQQITVRECVFDSTRRGAFSGILFRDSSHIWLAGNRFGQWGEKALIGDSAGYGDAVRLERVNYALIENNNFHDARAGHSLLHLTGRFGVLRGNNFQNAWQKDVELSGTDQTSAGGRVEAGPYLVEDNRFENAVFTVYTRKPDGSVDVAKGGVGLQTSASDSIFRGNIFASNQLTGLVASVSGQAQQFSNNHIYRNTFYNQPGGPAIRMTSYNAQARIDHNWLVNNLFIDNGFQENPDAQYSYSNPYEGLDRPGAGLQIMFDFAGVGGLENNRLQNNLFYQSRSGQPNLVAVNGLGDADIQQWQTKSQSASLFTDNRVADPRLDPTSGNFNLPPGSPAIDYGKHITNAVSNGENSTRLQVEDAGFFSDGWGLVAADWIRIGSGEPVRLVRVDYAAKALQLAEPRSWQSSDAVDLYRDSCGSIVLSGAAPDSGANEFGVTTPSDGVACK